MTNKKSSRPILVWVISAYSAYSILAVALISVWVLSNVDSSPLAFIVAHAFSPVEWVLMGLHVALEFSAACALFTLRRFAFPLSFMALCITAVQTLMCLLNYSQEFIVATMPWMIFSWVVDTGICLYARNLRSRGVLA